MKCVSALWRVVRSASVPFFTPVSATSHRRKRNLAADYLILLVLSESERIQKMSKALALDQTVLITSDRLNADTTYLSGVHTCKIREKGEKRQYQQQEDLKQPSCYCD
ncbi:hypothetical protein llap_16343 [Limosa lapponica baueri]|uniref:Uncharacterized protein n=1 Tax=Limosa lapponica baueri TaxID=1758121 RepID=A0A2I0THS5_LIMLA|nr:hypothetical protein llap_16343 [Limosa lapponica baueri]